MPESSNSQSTPTPSESRIRDEDYEVRQYLPEKGDFVDIPAGLLQYPPPKPVEFMYLQHYFNSASNIQQELKGCENAEEAVDILANEVSGMYHLLRGYIHNLNRYATKFDEEHEAIRTDMASITRSHIGLRRMVHGLYEKTIITDTKFEQLEREVAKLKTVPRRPPTIVRAIGRVNALKNPPMSKRDADTMKQRSREKGMELGNVEWVTRNQKELEQRALLAELARAPTLPSPAPESASASVPAPAEKNKNKTHPEKGKGKATGTPLNTRVEVKMEKLAEGLMVLRKGLAHAMDRTSTDLVHARTALKHEERHMQEAWAQHETLDHLNFQGGKRTERTERRVDGYGRWATACVEELGLTDVPTSSAASAEPSSQEEQGRSQEQAQEPESSSQDPGTSQGSPGSPSQDGASSQASTTTDASSQETTSTSATSLAPSPSPAPTISAAETTSDQPCVLESASQAAMFAARTEPELYAVSLNLKFDKKLEDLSRREAIAVLKALPVRIHFAPYIARESSTNEKEDNTAEGSQAPTRPAPSDHSQTGKATAHDVTQMVAPGGSNVQQPSKSKQAFKRRRPTDDVDGIVRKAATESRNDVRAAAGGSPVKKRRADEDNVIEIL